MIAIEKLFLNALHDLAAGYEMVQLMHAATIGFHKSLTFRFSIADAKAAESTG